MDVTTTASSLQAMRNLDAATTMSVEVAAACRDVNEIANATLAFLCRNCLMRSNASSIETLFNAHIDDTRMRPSPLIGAFFPPKFSFTNSHEANLQFGALAFSLLRLSAYVRLNVCKTNEYSRFI